MFLAIPIFLTFRLALLERREDELFPLEKKIVHLLCPVSDKYSISYPTSPPLKPGSKAYKSNSQQELQCLKKW